VKFLVLLPSSLDKIPEKLPIMMHAVFEVKFPGGMERGGWGGKFLPQRFLVCQSRDVGAVTHATCLARELRQGSGQG